MWNLLKFFFGNNNRVEDNGISSNVDMSAAQNNLFYLFNDPSTPELSEDIPIPVKPANVPNFVVQGFTNRGGDVGNDTWRAAQVYTTIIRSFSYFQTIAKTPIKKWAAVGQLNVLPKAGNDLNAYYDRRALKFFYAADPVTKKTMYTADAVDIVSHELGHAILDCVRPDLWNTQSLEVWAFHEAFGDMIALLTVMNSSKMVAKALAETNNDLSKRSCISKLAEQFGNTLYRHTKGCDGRMNDALRDAVNNFKYTKPELLPDNAPDNKLASECHSFSRVFSGAFYEIFTAIYAAKFSSSKNTTASVSFARDYVGNLIGKAIYLAPATTRFYDAVARSMLIVDQQMGGVYQDLIKNVFNNRKILINQKAKSNITALAFGDFNTNSNDQVESANGNKYIRKYRNKTIRLADHVGITAQSNNPLYHLDIEVPYESLYEFDNKGFMASSISGTEKDAIKSAIACLDWLHKKDFVDFERKHNKMFSAVDGKLFRNHVICGCHHKY